MVQSFIVFNFLSQSSHLVFTKICEEDISGPASLDSWKGANFPVNTQRVSGRVRNLDARCSPTAPCQQLRQKYLCCCASFSITLLIRGMNKRALKSLISAMLIIQGNILRRRMQDSENIIIENPQESHRLLLSGHLGSLQPRTVTIWQFLQVYMTENQW